MNYGKVLFALTALVISSSAVAGELDRDTSAAPQSLIVRVDASGNREVFKANTAVMVHNEQDAALAAQLATTENRVEAVIAGNELDRTSSVEAWCHWYAPTYYGNYGSYYYSYYNYSYNYSWNYYPYYRWNSYGYSYYYYYGYRY